MNEKITEILNWLEEYKNATNCKGVVLGISGGKDSTVVAMLAKKVWGSNVVGVLMPNSIQADIHDSKEIVKVLDIKHHIVNIGSAYEDIISHIQYTRISPLDLDGIEQVAVTEKAKTNIPPRLRMIVLYCIAQSLGYRVIGTGNASEAYIGWTTKWGDSAYDFNPIYHLTCGEVIEIGKELAREFGLDEKFINKTPSDGLTGKSDEDNFGFTYDCLDSVIKGESDSTAAIDLLHKMSEHKRTMPYTLTSKTNTKCPNCGCRPFDEPYRMKATHCPMCGYIFKEHEMSYSRKSELYDNMLNHISELVSGNDLVDTLHAIGFTDQEIAQEIGG